MVRILIIKQESNHKLTEMILHTDLAKHFDQVKSKVNRTLLTLASK